MKDDILLDIQEHYTKWRDDNNIRMKRKGGWNDCIDAYWGKLPEDWPYINKVVDPRIRTSLLEKNARLLNNKLRGRLVPREGSDILKAKLNNSILEFQWDNANEGGSMLQKWAMMDSDARIFGSSFALVTWKYEEDVFEGNEFIKLDIRDCGIDPTAQNVKNAKWFQVRRWHKIADLERQEEVEGIKNLNLKALKDAMYNSQDRRDNEFNTRELQLKGLSDRTGEDKAFPVVEIVTEYRADRQITFSPKYNVVLRDIKNPYAHGKINVVQLKYYPLGNDPIGESEVENVLPIWKAIQATLCGYLDNMNMHIRPPLKVIDGQARLETIIYGPEALWMVNNPNAVTELQSNGEAIRYFQSTYSALVSAYNAAMGEASQGTSNADPFNPQKTATEIKYISRQQNVRDQMNQMYLSEAIADCMMMWQANNKQFLFCDPEKHEHVLKIVGSDSFNYFKQSGLDEMILPEESASTISDIIMQTEGNMSPDDLNMMVESGKVPKYPIDRTPKEKNPEKKKIVPKMEMSELNDEASVYLTPEDVDGDFDYIADVQSMSAGAHDILLESQQAAINLIKDPNVLQLLAGEGVTPKIKDLLVTFLGNTGLNDSERYFSTAQAEAPTGAPTGAGAQPPMPEQGMAGIPQAPIGGVPNNQMAQPTGV